MTFKKAVTALITFLAVVTLTACGKKGADSQDNWKKFESKNLLLLVLIILLFPWDLKTRMVKMLALILT